MKEQDRLLASFCSSVRHSQVSGFEVLELLDTRSTLSQQEKRLSEKARKQLEEADSLFLKHAHQFYAAVTQVADLEDMRRRAFVTPSHWWWYLEKLTVERAAV